MKQKVMIMRQVGLCMVALWLSASAAFAQSNTSVTFAGVQGGQMSIFTYDPEADTLEIEHLPSPPAVEGFDNLSWSPDGLVLSFTQNINPHLELEPSREELIFAPLLPAHHPYLVETSLSRNLEPFFAPQFDASGYLTYVIRPPEDTIYEGDDFYGVVLDVYQQYAIAGQLPQHIGQIVYGYGCGHTPSSPMEALQDAEGGLKSLVAQTPFGVVFSPFCLGRGVALSTEGTFTLLHDSLGLAAMAPDHIRLAGWDAEAGAIAHYDLAAQTSSACAVEDEVTQLAWGADGAALYYSTRYRSGEFEFTQTEADTLNQIITLSETLTARYGVSLYALTPETCASELLYTNADAYAISRIQPLGERVLFSEIENGDAWFAQMLASGQSARDIVGLTLYDLPFGGEAHGIGQGIEKVAVRPN